MTQRTTGAAGAVLLALAALLASCATGPFVQREPNVLALVELINRGGVNDVAGLAEAPFLFDGEILLLQADVDTLWDNLKRAGFRLEGAAIEKIEHLSADSYKAFGTTMDVRVFFSTYLDSDTSLVRLRSRSGSYYLLLNREVRGYPRIQGFKGPLS